MKSVHSFISQHAKIGILIIRITLGGVFLFHGISKLSNMDGTIAFFGSLGFSVFWAWVVALVETIGGGAVIIGIGTRIFASLLAIIMLVVITTVKNGKGFQAMEIDVILLGLALGVGLIGCGKWSLCHMNHKGTCDNKDGHCGCECDSSKNNK